MIQDTELEKEAFAVFPKCPIPTEFRSCCTEHVTPRLDFLGAQIAAAAPIHSDTNISDPVSHTSSGLASPVLTSNTTSPGHGKISRVLQVSQEYPHGSSWIGSRYICLYCSYSMKENEACSFKLKTEEI